MHKLNYSYVNNTLNQDMPSSPHILYTINNKYKDNKLANSLNLICSMYVSIGRDIFCYLNLNLISADY